MQSPLHSELFLSRLKQHLETMLKFIRPNLSNEKFNDNCHFMASRTLMTARQWWMYGNQKGGGRSWANFETRTNLSKQDLVWHNKQVT